MEHAWQLIARKFSGEATPEESYELLQLQYRQPELRYYIYFLSEWWNTAEKSGKEEAGKAFDKILQQLEMSNSYFIESRKKKLRSFVFGNRISGAISYLKNCFRRRGKTI